MSAALEIICSCSKSSMIRSACSASVRAVASLAWTFERALPAASIFLSRFFRMSGLPLYLPGQLLLV
jgi:hypothetical protein